MVLEALRNIAITLSLAFLIPFTLIYGVRVFYPKPQLTYPPEHAQLTSELGVLQKQRNKAFYDRSVILEQKKENLIQEAGNKHLAELEQQVKEKSAQLDSLRKPVDKAYQEAEYRHGKIELIVGCLIGIMLIILGLFFPTGSIGSGLLFGGTACIGYSFLWNYNIFSEKILFLLLLTAVSCIIAIAYYLNLRDRKPKQ